MRTAYTKSEKAPLFRNVLRCCIVLAGMVAAACFTLNAEAGRHLKGHGESWTEDLSPVTTCDVDGIGKAHLFADAPVTIDEVSEEVTPNGVDYCLVKVKVPEAIHIWVGLPMNGEWNGRLQSLGGGVYCGFISAPISAVSEGYVGVTTDTGHEGFVPPGVPPDLAALFAMLDGSFAMLAPGEPNIPLQIDFSYRSEHLMAVIGKQLTRAFYGHKPLFSYWNGCSTGGRQGLAMAQRYPWDYNGILAGAPAIHFDRFQAAHMWPPMVQELEGYVPSAKKTLATEAAVAACDGLDGVIDGILRDPRQCDFDAEALICREDQDPDDCLTEAEASAIDRLWYGPTNEKGNQRLWYGLTRGTDLTALGGGSAFFDFPFPVAVEQPRYWVYFDPEWDWHYLDYSNYEDFFDDTVDAMAESGTATDNPNLAPFRAHGGKLIMWHGFNDELIFPEGTIDYYDRVVKTMGGGYRHTRKFARLFMAPGVAHCGGGTGPAPLDAFQTLVDWVEKGEAPDTILAAQVLPDGKTRTRPLCPYPDVAEYIGSGSADDAANFVCTDGRYHYPHHKRRGYHGKWNWKGQE